MTKTPPENADPEEDNDDDEDNPNVIPGNIIQGNANGALPADAFLNLLYLAREQSVGSNTMIELPLGDGNNSTLAYRRHTDSGNSDCCCYDSDEYSDGDYDDEDSEIEIILEEIRRINEALLGTTVSELIDAERRVSLKDFDELAARDESLLEEWDYDDSEICEHDDDCQGVVERIQLFMRSHPAQLSESIRREVTELRGSNCRPTRPCDTPNRRVPTPGGASNIYVVYFEPRKLGMFPKLATKEESKTNPKLKRTVSLKKASKKMRFGKDSVRRWSEDEEKAQITRILHSVWCLPDASCDVAVPRLPSVPWAGMQISLESMQGPPPPAPPLPPSPPPQSPAANVQVAAVVVPDPLLAPFAVTLPVGAAASTEVHVVLFANRVLAAEVVQHVARAPPAPAPELGNPAAREAGFAGEGDAGEGGAGEGDDAGAAAYAAAGWLACESVLVRRWLVPEGVDLGTLRCFLGDGLLLIAAYPLPDGFVWPFAVPPATLGPPLRVAWACDYVP